jgi:hypothetical protein
VPPAFSYLDTAHVSALQPFDDLNLEGAISLHGTQKNKDVLPVVLIAVNSTRPPIVAGTVTWEDLHHPITLLYQRLNTDPY